MKYLPIANAYGMGAQVERRLGVEHVEHHRSPTPGKIIGNNYLSFGHIILSG